ncbi:MAG: MOSC domain-containing protein [Bryobacterales bacterium]|nr:MOSC domain-containing protein [Bryobacterales bacterium]
MKVLSVNTGKPRLVPAGNLSVQTAIFKSPVQGRVTVRVHNMDGDQQADLTVHGGPHKAVYLYPSEHYGFWSEELPGTELPYGMFGENLTTLGMDEETVRIGDRYRIGSATLQVTQPRMPCYKLGIRFDRPDIVKRFWHSGRSGIYFSVVQEGELAAGDSIETVASAPDSVTVAQVVRLARGGETEETLHRALRAPLFGGWKEELESRWYHARNLS